ncbi:hypothetical protein [Butyrivibrio sp. CB08]|uniref:hypothetical protein n=1 Tax=Butyrivibrio sp. CB08 TaxID=2364879 RepID=UPI0013146D23|nr:hypothetical protein [Butyrivibrio sp. CB08]
MEKSVAKTMSGKHVPATITAVKIGERYLDPMYVKLKIFDYAAMGIGIFVMGILFTHLL